MNRIVHIFSPNRATLISFFSFLISSPAYDYCRLQHYNWSTAGLLQHVVDPDEVVLSRLVDGVWICGFTCSVAAAFLSDISFRYVFVYALGVGLLSCCGPNILVIPVQCALSLFALACLKGWIP